MIECDCCNTVNISLWYDCRFEWEFKAEQEWKEESQGYAEAGHETSYWGQQSHHQKNKKRKFELDPTI